MVGGIMEKQIFFELYDGAFWLSIFVSVLGVAIIAGVLWCGLKIAPNRDAPWNETDPRRWEIRWHYLLSALGKAGT